MKFPTAFFGSLTWRYILAAGSVCAHLLLETTASSAAILLGQNLAPKPTKPIPQLIAGADNFNPALKVPPPREYIKIPPPPPPAQAPAEAKSGAEAPFIVLEKLQPNLQNTWNNSDQVNRTIEETAVFLLNNGDRLFFTTGYNTYEQPDTRTVTNIPIEIAWETKVNSLKFRQGVGVDLLGRFTTANFNFKVEYPVMAGLILSADVQQGAYKFNAKTIENQISALRYGPSIFWQLDKETSLFSTLHLGNYSDSNQEQQSFSRIERKLGSFAIAGNLFTWNYKNPTTQGYFAPQDFMVYTGELSWEGDVLQDFLRCRLSVSLGQQQANAQNSDALGYQTKCTAKISTNIEADLGYSFSNIKTTQPSAANVSTQSIGTQIRIKF